MDIAAIEKLPYEAISCEPIRRAAAALSAAKAAAHEARKTHVQLTQELPNAHLEDARADELARAEGKPKLKGRPATQAAEKAIDDAEHEQRVSVLAAQRAKRELATAIDEHGNTWAAEVADATGALRADWQTSIGELIGLYGRLSAALSVAHVVGADVPGMAAVRFRARQIDELEIASGQHDPHGLISTGDVLAGLADLGTPEPEHEPEPVQRTRAGAGSDLLRGQAGVEAEIAERRQFAERV